MDLKHAVRVNLDAKPAKIKAYLLAMLLWTHGSKTPSWRVPHQTPSSQDVTSFSFFDIATTVCERMLTLPVSMRGSLSAMKFGSVCALQSSIYGARSRCVK